MFTAQARVIIVDDHPSVLLGLSHELQRLTQVELVGTATNSGDMLDLIGDSGCDILISDYIMPSGRQGDGLALFSYLRRHYPAMAIVVITMIDNSGVFRELKKLGVRGLLSKLDAVFHVTRAVEEIMQGGEYSSPEILSAMSAARKDSQGNLLSLSKRELEVVRLFCSGLTVQEIAERQYRSKQTVSAQKVAAMRKLGVSNDKELLRYAMDMGFVP